jgi:hypothetical protein
MARWSVVKLVLLLLNATSTVLTLFTGLSENPVIVMVTGKYDRLRERLRDGSINTDIADADHFRIDTLAPPATIADYKFITAPPRNPTTMGLNRSVCTNINTNTAPVMANSYNDTWGQGPRRVQVYYYSISAPHCKVLNVKPAWHDTCVADRARNATLCHEYVLANFDALLKNRKIRMGVNNDFGGKGVPLMRCVGRPLTPLEFQADLLAHQTYWSGGTYHVSIQTSDCRGEPLVRSDDLEYTLFRITNVDEGNVSIQAMPPGGWFTQLVSALYSTITLFMIVRGIVLALFHTRMVQYLPNGVRYTHDRRFLRYVLPFMPAAIAAAENDRSVITFKGSLLVASDLWMNHWLYMDLSILDTLANLRLAYVTLQVGTFMLNNKVTFESYLFLIGAVTRMTWILCFLQTLLRFLFKSLVRLLRATRLIRSTTREKLEWGIDGASMFLTFKLYNILLCLLLYTLLQVKGSPSFMVRASVFKVGVYGGTPKIAHFWSSEIMCDFTSLLGIVLLAGQAIGFGLLLTKYRYVADNSVMRLLQRRYLISGWDSLLAASMLGLDLVDPEFIVDGCGRTKFGLGSLLQLLYLSGPSGFTHLAGDYIFHDGGLAKEPVKFKYPVATALSMGLPTNSKYGSVFSKGVAITSSDVTVVRTHASHQHAAAKSDMADTVAPMRKSIFERKLRIVTEGYLGKVLLVDDDDPGRTVTNKETGLREFQVVDALSVIGILDIKYLLGNEKKIRVE